MRAVIIFILVIIITFIGKYTYQNITTIIDGKVISVENNIVKFDKTINDRGITTYIIYEAYLKNAINYDILNDSISFKRYNAHEMYNEVFLQGYVKRPAYAMDSTINADFNAIMIKEDTILTK